VDERFTVKSLYVALDGMLLVLENLNTSQAFAFKNIWKSTVPSKVSSLAWQLLLDRIPTRQNLRRRNVIRSHDAYCPFCALEVESARHLFLHCRFTAAVWYALNRWLEVMIVLPPDPLMSYCLLVGTGGNKNLGKACQLFGLLLCGSFGRLEMTGYLIISMETWRKRWTKFSVPRGNGIYRNRQRDPACCTNGFGTREIVCFGDFSGFFSATARL
jgi:hypothetical protein